MIRVVVDDLAFLEVDAVLRPANHTLDPASSISARLDQMAGQTFVATREVVAPLEVGSAVVTAAGDLAAPFVLHVVISTDEVNADRTSVQRALASAWHRATEWQLERVAMPLVGTGAGQLSMEDAARLLQGSLGSRSHSEYPKEVQLVVDREADKELLEQLLGTGEES